MRINMRTAMTASATYSTWDIVCSRFAVPPKYQANSNGLMCSPSRKEALATTLERRCNSCTAFTATHRHTVAVHFPSPPKASPPAFRATFRLARFLLPPAPLLAYSQKMFPFDESRGRLLLGIRSFDRFLSPKASSSHSFQSEQKE